MVKTKSYIYTYKKLNTNHFLTIYRVKDNIPILLKKNVNIGYRGIEEAIINVIVEVEHKPKPEDKKELIKKLTGKVKYYQSGEGTIIINLV